MVKNIVANSQLLENVALGSTFFHCCLLLLLEDSPFELTLLLYTTVLISILINNHYRGTRVHLWPLISGFSFYSITLLFGILEEMAFYYYYLTCLISLMIVYFFGSVEVYQGFVPSGRYSVGCKET